MLHLKPSPPDLNGPAERQVLRWDHSSQNPSGAAVSGGEFTSERPCWRPPRRPSASRSEQPAAPPSCWPWPHGAGCPGSQTSQGPRHSDCRRRRRRTTTRAKQHEEKTRRREKSAGKRKVQRLYRTDGNSTVDVFFSNIEVRKQPDGRQGTQERMQEKTEEEEEGKEKMCAGGSDQGV